MKVTANGLQIEVDDTGGEGRPVILLIICLLYTSPSPRDS